MQTDFTWGEVGARIRAWRVARQMSQSELAEVAGLTQAGVSAIEDGTTNPQLSSLQRIASVFGRSVRELICGPRPSAGSRAEQAIQVVRLVLESEDPLAEDVLIQALHNALRIVESHAAVGWRPKRGKVSPAAQEWSEMVKRSEERLRKQFPYRIVRGRAPVYQEQNAGSKPRRGADIKKRD